MRTLQNLVWFGLGAVVAILALSFWDAKWRSLGNQRETGLDYKSLGVFSAGEGASVPVMTDRSGRVYRLVVETGTDNWSFQEIPVRKLP